MSEASPDPDEEILARLAAFDLAAAERVHGRLMAAEDAAEIAELGRTYQRVARSLRQTLALKAKLKRDRETAAKDAPPAPPPPTGLVAIARRERDLRQAVRRVIWNEAEDADSATLLEEMFNELMIDEIPRGGFRAEALDEHVIRVCLELDLSLDAAERWRDLPEAPPEEEDDPDEADHRSSA
jgi:hypothetical protein